MIALLAGVLVVGGMFAVTKVSLAGTKTLAAGSIQCPSVADKVGQVPGQARAEVDRNLALLDQQIREANQRLASSAGQGGPNFVQNAIVNPLASKRTATIDRIAIAIGRVGQRPQGLNNVNALAQCRVVNAGGNNNAGNNNGGNNNGGNNNGGNNNGGNNNGGNNNAGGVNTVAPGGRDGNNNGQQVLGRDCSASRLPTHEGFQDTDARCVVTQMGEVAAEDRLPSLLIVNAPRQVNVGQNFTVQVSTRNLVRDRFLGAAAGGYYLERSFLNNQGLQRGHFHFACRILDNTNIAPNSAPPPDFFKAVEDGGGGAQPDVVNVDVTGINRAGALQCTAWAGDGSHRSPMMTRANQTPAIDSVRIQVGNGGQNNNQQGRRRR